MGGSYTRLEKLLVKVGTDIYKVGSVEDSCSYQLREWKYVCSKGISYEGVLI